MSGIPNDRLARCVPTGVPIDGPDPVTCLNRPSVAVRKVGNPVHIRIPDMTSRAYPADQFTIRIKKWAHTEKLREGLGLGNPSVRRRATAPGGGVRPRPAGRKKKTAAP